MDEIFAPWRIEWVQREDGGGLSGCPFCVLPERTEDRENRVVARSEHSFVLLNNYPYSPGHVMVIPRRHTGDWSDLPDAELLDHAKLKARTLDALDAALDHVAAGGVGMAHLGETLMVFLSRPHELMEIFSGPSAIPMTMTVFGRLLLAAAPVILLPALLVLALLIAQRGIVMAPEKVKPKLSRISPISNAKQKFGPEGLFQFAKSSAKLIVVSFLLGAFLLDRITGWPLWPPWRGVQ